MSAPPVGFDDHPCLSAQASCSGLVPCAACLMALETHCVPRALLASSAIMEQAGEPSAQVKAYFEAFDAARRKLVADIRQAWIAHQARLQATREALQTEPPVAASAPSPVPAASPSPPGPAPAPAPEAPSKAKAAGKRASSAPSQVVPIGRPKRTPAVVAAETATLDSLFTQAVTPASAPSSALASSGTSTTGSTKAKTP